MQRYVIGNWKCHKSSDDGRRWFDKFAGLYRPQHGVHVIVAPTMVSLERIAQHLEGLHLENVSLAAQDVSPFPKGGYTGAVAADMIKNLARYVIVGHSERRRYFHESNQEVVNKACEAADSGIVPIVCVDGTDARSLLEPLVDIDCKQLLVAYTPVDALNFKIPEPPAKVAESVIHLRQMYPSFQVIYGGALQADNVREYLQLPSLSGVFIGSSSLEPETFAEICSQAAALD